MAEGMFGSNIKTRPVSALGTALKAHKPLAVHQPAVKKVSFHGPSMNPHPSLKAPSTRSSSSSSSLHLPSTSGRYLAATGTPGKGGGGSILGGLEHDVTSFIGHLGSDVVNTAMGFPVGIAYMIQHPIAGAEGAVKATWSDWSPLFHGDYGLWAHNFYEHPLAPILDVAGVVSFGAGTAARIADVGVAAKAAMATDDAAALATRTGSVARWANPLKAAAAKNWAKAGQDEAKFRSLMSADPEVRRIVTGKSGSVLTDTWSRNPYTRAIQKGRSAAANKVAESSIGKGLKVDKIIGDQATFRRWNHLDKGRRAAAVQVAIEKQLGALSKAGKLSSAMRASEKVGITVPVVHDLMKDNARPLVGVANKDINATALKEDGLTMLRDLAHVDSGEKIGRVGGKAGRRLTLSKLLAQTELAETRGAEHDAVLAGALRKMGPLLTTKNLEHAARDGDGNILVVSNTLAHKLANETLQGDRVVRQLYREPLKVWRHLMLGLSPRYFVNNFVGNSIMLMAATDPVSLWKAYRNHVNIVHGAETAAKLQDDAIVTAANQMSQNYQTMLQALPNPASSKANYFRKQAAQVKVDAEEEVAKQQTLREVAGGNRTMTSGKRAGLNPLEHHLAGEHQTMSREAYKNVGGVTGFLNRFPSLYGPTHKLADLPQRYMAMNYSLMRMPEYQTLLSHYKNGGMSLEDASYKAAEEALRSPDVRHAVQLQTTHMLGQYHTFSKFEKGIKNNLVPFYAWDRAITQHMAHLVMEQPYKVAMGAAIGSQGNAKVKEMIGEVPDFVKSMIPLKMLGMGGSDPGRVASLNAMSLSPYGSVADLVTSAEGLVGGGTDSASSLGGQLNPIVQGIISSLQDSPTTPPPTFLGMKGPVGAIAGNLTSVPQLNMLGSIVGRNAPNVTSSGNPTLYEHNAQAAVSSFLGVPIRQVSPAAGKRDAEKMSGQKKKHPFGLANPPGF